MAKTEEKTREQKFREECEKNPAAVENEFKAALHGLAESVIEGGMPADRAANAMFVVGLQRCLKLYGRQKMAALFVEGAVTLDGEEAKVALH